MPNTYTSVPGSTRTLSYTQSGYLEGDQTQTYAWWDAYDLRPDRVRTLKPSGWLYPKGYSIASGSYRYCMGSKLTFYTNGALQTSVQGVIPGATSNHPCMDHINLSGYSDKAVIKCLTELKGQTVNLGVALGEARSTAKTINGGGIKRIQQVANLAGSRLSQVARAYRSFRKGRWKESAATLGIRQPAVAPSAWLELQYGWKPLLSDIYGATSALSEERPLIRDGFTKTVKSSIRTTDDYSVYQDLGSSGVNELTRRAQGGVLVRLDYEPSNTFLQTITSVGLTNPLEVAWELVPFSFVIDWAFPLGQWLSCLDADVGWNFRSGSITYFQKTAVSIVRAYSNSPSVTGNWSGAVRKVNMNRQVYLDSPLPSFPGIKNPFSVGHLANGLSLIASIAAGSSSRR